MSKYLPRLNLEFGRGLLWRGGVDSPRCDHLPEPESVAHGGFVRLLVALEDGARALPAAKLAEITKRRALEFARELPAKCVPAQAGNVSQTSTCARLFPPIAHEMT